MKTKEEKIIGSTEKLLAKLSFEVVMKGVRYDNDAPVVIATRNNAAFGIPCGKNSRSWLRNVLRRQRLLSKKARTEKSLDFDSLLIAEIDRTPGRINLSNFESVDQAADFFCFPL